MNGAVTIETNTPAEGRSAVLVQPSQRRVNRARQVHKAHKEKLEHRSPEARQRATVAKLAGAGWTKQHPIERKANTRVATKKARKQANANRRRGR